MNICLISPGHLVTNPRLVKEARTLQALGHSVTVVCGRYSLWGIEQDLVIERGIDQVIPVCFGPVATTRPVYLRQTLIRHMARSVTRLFGVRSRRLAAIAQHPIHSDITRAALNIQADLFIAHYVAALPAAAAAAKQHRAAYAFDAEDFHLGDLPDLEEHKYEKSLIRSIEQIYLPKASYVSAASPLIAQAYENTYGIKLPTTLLNLFPRAAGPSVPSAAGCANPGPSLYWFSQVVGPGRGLEDAVRALAYTKLPVHLHLRGQPASGFVNALFEQARASGVQERIHILDPVEPDRLEKDGSRFDIGYAGDQAETRNRQIALTNKLFSYLCSGIPVIATDIPAHREILARLGDACSIIPLGDPRALAVAIDEMMTNPETLARRRHRAWSLGQGPFAWETQVSVLDELVNSSVGRNS